MTTATALDFTARYTAPGFAGIALAILGYATETVWSEPEVACEDPECDHMLSEMCWYAPEAEVVEDTTKVRVMMVGDDVEYTVDVDDLTVIGDLDYCVECGQIGCTADGR